MTPQELHAALTATLATLAAARNRDDPYGYAFGPHPTIYGFRPGWPYQPLPRPAVHPPTPPAFVTPRTPGFGTSGWNFGQGGGLPPDVRIGVQGLHNWLPTRVPPVNT